MNIFNIKFIVLFAVCLNVHVVSNCTATYAIPIALPKPNTITFHNFFPYPDDSGTIPLGPTHLTEFFTFTNSYNSLIEANFVAGVLMGHMITSTYPNMNFDKDYLYGSMFGQLMQESGDMSDYAMASNKKNHPDDINSIVNYKPLMGIGEGGPYQINNFSTRLVSGGYGLINFNALQYGLGYFVANQDAVFIPNFYEVSYVTPPALDNVYFAPIATAYFHYNDLISSESRIVGNGGVDNGIWNTFIANLSSGQNPSQYLDIFLNAIYNSGPTDAHCIAIVKAIANPTPATNSAIDSYAEDYCTYIGEGGLNVGDKSTENFCTYPRKVRFYLDQLYNNTARVGEWITIDNSNIMVSNYSELRGVFVNGITQLGYATSPATNKNYNLISNEQATNYFNSAMTSNSVTDSTSIHISSSDDRNKMYSVIDRALTNLETNLSFKFTDATELDLSKPYQIDDDFYAIPTSTTATVYWNVDKLDNNPIPTGGGVVVSDPSIATAIATTADNINFSATITGLNQSKAYTYLVYNYKDDPNNPSTPIYLAEQLDTFTTTSSDSIPSLSIHNVVVSYNQDNTQATLTWQVIFANLIDNVTNSVVYSPVVYAQLPANITTKIINDHECRCLSVIDIIPGVLYNYTITATANDNTTTINQGGSFTAGNATNTNPITITLVLGNLFTSSTDSSATIAWLAVDSTDTNNPAYLVNVGYGINPYPSEIEFNGITHKTDINRYNYGDINIITIPSLSNNTSYQYKITDTSANGSSTYGGTIRTGSGANTNSLTLDNVNVTLGSDATIETTSTISWSASYPKGTVITNSIKYAIGDNEMVDGPAVTSYPNPSTTGFTDSCSITLTGLLPNTTYNFQIKAQDANNSNNNVSYYDDFITAKYVAPPNTITIDLNSVTVVDLTATINWGLTETSSVQPTMTSSISFDNSPAVPVTSEDTVLETFNYVATNLVSGKVYNYKIFATDGINHSVLNGTLTVGSTTPVGELRINYITEETDSTGTNETISWEVDYKNINNVVNTIKYAIDSSAEVDKSNLITTNISGTVNKCSISLIDLLPNKTYYYTIEAKDSTNESVDVLYNGSFSTIPPIPKPTNNIITSALNSISTTTTTATISWKSSDTDSSPLTSTILFNNVSILVTHVLDVYSCEVTGLSSSTSYPYIISTTDGSNVYEIGGTVKTSSTSANELEIYTIDTLVHGDGETVGISWTENYNGDINNVVNTLTYGIDDSAQINAIVTTVISGNNATCSTTLTDLTPGTLYKFTVEAKDGANVDIVSKNNFTTGEISPISPPNVINLTLNSISTTTTTATISWKLSETDSSPLTSSIVFNDGTSTIVTPVSGIYTYTATNLSNNTTYSYTISTTDGLNTYSVGGTVKTTSVSPTNELTISSINRVLDSDGTKVTIFWDVNYTGSISNVVNSITYAIGSGTPITPSVTVATVDSTDKCSVVLSGLTPNTTYNYIIEAKDGANADSTANGKFKTTISGQHNPITIILNSASSNETTATISWELLDVDLNNSSSLLSTIIFNNNIPKSIMPDAEGLYTYVATNLSNNMQYQYKIFASDSVHNDSVGGVVKTGTTATGAGLTFDSVSQIVNDIGTSATISWSVTYGGDIANLVNSIKYAVDNDTQEVGPNVTVVTKDNTDNCSVILTNLIPNKIYNFTIKAKDDDKISVLYEDFFSTTISKPTNNITIALDEGYPNIEFSNITGDSRANFSWTTSESNGTVKLVNSISVDNKPLKIIKNNNHYTATFVTSDSNIIHSYKISATAGPASNYISGTLLMPNVENGATAASQYSWTSQPGSSPDKNFGLLTFQGATGGTPPYTYAVTVSRIDGGQSSVDIIKVNLLTYQIINMYRGVAYNVNVVAYDAHGVSASETNFQIINNW